MAPGASSYVRATFDVEHARSRWSFPTPGHAICGMGPTLLVSAESTLRGTLCWILKFGGIPPPGGFNVGVLPASRCTENEYLRSTGKCVLTHDGSTGDRKPRFDMQEKYVEVICDCKERKCMFLVGDSLDTVVVVKTLRMDYQEEVKLAITGFNRVEVMLESSSKGHVSALKRGLEYTPEQIVAKRMRGVWANRAFTDAVVKCGARTFQVHRSVLAEVSPVLGRMFESGFQESAEAALTVREVDEETVAEFLEFAYTGQAPTLAQDPDPTTEQGLLARRQQRLLLLLEMASMYQVEELIVICAKHLLAEGLVDGGCVVQVLRSLRSLEAASARADLLGEVRQLLHADLGVFHAVVASV